MIPVLWQSLSLSLIRQLCTTFFSIVIFLLLLRAEEIARFASMGASAFETALLALYLIPVAMPLSLPLALLVAASSLTKRLCQTGELIALTTSGLNIWSIYRPLIYISLLVCLFNGWIASEWSAVSSLSIRKMKTKLSFLSPEKVTEKNPFLKIGDRLLFSMPSPEKKERTLFVVGGDSQHWDLYQMKQMQRNGHQLQAQSTSLMKLELSCDGSFEKLQLENAQKSELPSKRIPFFAKNLTPSYSFNHLNLKQLLSRYKKAQNLSLPVEKAQILHELFKRLFCLLSPLATLSIGIYSSLSIDRKAPQNRLALLLIIILIAGYFFALHSPHLKNLTPSSAILPYCGILSGWMFLTPLWFCSNLSLKKIKMITN